MGAPIFQLRKINNRWYNFELTVRVNLKTIALVVLAVAAFIAVCFVGYWLLQLIIGLFSLVGAGIYWLSQQWLWLLGLALLASIIWGLSKINWKNISVSKPQVSPKFGRYLLMILAILALLALCFFGFKSCGQDKAIESEQITIEESDAFINEFDKTFDYVVTSRAYLDGVQQSSDSINRALVGLKYVDGKPVKASDFSGKTYDEAVKIIARNWRGLVAENLNGVSLSKQQLVTVILFAMRNGEYGFETSDFLKAIKQGQLLDADKFMALHKASGTKRQLGEEAQKYLWVLKNLWRGNLLMEELLDLPMFSYKNLSLEEMYEGGSYQNNLKWSEELHHKLSQHSNPTPRTALGL